MQNQINQKPLSSKSPSVRAPEEEDRLDLSDAEGEEFPCTFQSCDKKYTNKYSLKRHLATHNPSRRFSCQFCGKKFALAQYLKDHLNVHTGHKPYRCKYPGCDQAFSQAGKLSIHNRSHQNKLFHVQKMNKRAEK